MVGCGKFGMDVLLEALVARMAHWAVVGRQYQPFVSLFASRCAPMMGRRALAC